MDNAANGRADLGPLLFTHRPARELLFTASVVPLTFVAIGVPMMFLPKTDDRRAGQVIAVAAAVVAIYPVARLVRAWRTRTHVHERGVRQTVGRRERVLLFEDVRELTCERTATKVNASYQYTDEKITLRPTPGERKGQVRLVRRYKAGAMSDDPKLTANMERLRVRLAALVARRLEERVTAGEEIAWDRRVFITADGLKLTRSGVTVPWNKLKVKVDYGTIFLESVDRNPDHSRARAAVSASRPNALAALCLVDQFVARSRTVKTTT
jgi:hypothetical protein